MLLHFSSITLNLKYMNPSLFPLLLIFVSLLLLYSIGIISNKKPQVFISRVKYIPATLMVVFMCSSAFAKSNDSETYDTEFQQIEIPPSVFEENPIYDFGLSLTYQISGSVYKMINGYNLSPGHVTGYSFEPTNVNTVLDRKTNKVIYTLEGNLNWNFLGITFLSQKREYQGS